MALYRRCSLSRLARQRRLQALAHEASRVSDASNWQQISAFQARVREAERKARHRLKPKTKFKPRRRRARRYSTLAVKAPTVQSAGPIQRVADALGVPVSLMTNPRPDLTAAPEFDEAQRRAALYSTDPNAVLQARVTGRVGAHINAMKAVAYSTQGQVAAMQGLTMVKQRLRRAGLVAVLRRQPPGKLKHFIFHHWRKRSQDKIRRNINQNLAAEYFVNRTLIKYLRWWQFLGHVAVARRMAVRMGNTRIRRKCFRAWKRFVTMQATVAANRDLFRNAAIRELAMKAELSAADRERLFREMWLPQVFASIKAEARCVHAHARLPGHGWGCRVCGSWGCSRAGRAGTGESCGGRHTFDDTGCCTTTSGGGTSARIERRRSRTNAASNGAWNRTWKPIVPRPPRRLRQPRRRQN